MNGTKLLLDSNIALYLLGGDNVLASLLEQREVYVSVITEMELLGYPGISEHEILRVNDFLQECNIVELGQPIKEKAIELRRTYNIKLPDAIIASTAIHLNLPLISADGVFNRLSELNFVHYTF